MSVWLQKEKDHCITSSVYGLDTLNTWSLHLSLAMNSVRLQRCWESKNILHILASKRRKLTCGNEKVTMASPMGIPITLQRTHGHTVTTALLQSKWPLGRSLVPCCTHIRLALWRECQDPEDTSPYDPDQLHTRPLHTQCHGARTSFLLSPGYESLCQ